MNCLVRFLSEEDGATATEYAVMLGLIIIGIIASIGTVGGQNANLWSDNQTKITNAMDAVSN